MADRRDAARDSVSFGVYRSVAVVVALGVGALLVGPIACRQIAGIGSSPQTDLATSVCGLPFGTPSCASCAMENCCTESTACAADPSCEPYGSCMGQCKGEPKCWAQCLLDHPTEAPSASTLDACMEKSCETACGLTCGAFAGAPLDPDAAVACQACLVGSACADTRACAMSSDCNAVEHCVPLCPTLDCIQACEIAHGVDPAYGAKPDGGTPSTWQTFSTARASCNGPCASGGDWSCVGHVSWSQPKTVSATYNFWIKDGVNLTPIPGATVSLCAEADETCAGYVARAMTDSSGAVSLPFQNVAAGQQVTGFAGYLLVTAPTLVDYYYYWGTPISEPQIDTYGEPLTPDELQNFWAGHNVKLDSARGVLGVAVYDCAFSSAAGVRVDLDTMDSLTKAFTVAGEATTTTDATGILVFANVPAGAVRVTATPVALGAKSGTVAAEIHAGADTTVLLFPTP